MIIDERKSREAAVVEAARIIMTSGRTAPKGKGLDLIEITALTKESVHALAGALREASEETGLKFFLRDADNIDAAGAVILAAIAVMEAAPKKKSTRRFPAR